MCIHIYLIYSHRAVHKHYIIVRLSRYRRPTIFPAPRTLNTGLVKTRPVPVRHIWSFNRTHVVGTALYIICVFCHQRATAFPLSLYVLSFFFPTEGKNNTSIDVGRGHEGSKTVRPPGRMSADVKASIFTSVYKLYKYIDILLYARHVHNIEGKTRTVVPECYYGQKHSLIGVSTSFFFFGNWIFYRAP